MQTGSPYPRYFSYKYPQDYTTDIYKTMVYNNMLSLVIENIAQRYNGNITENHKVNLLLMH